MSKFEKALAKSKNVESSVDEIDKDNADAGLLLNTIAEEFKDWQPPKQLLEVQQIVADWFEDSMEGTFSGVISSYAFNNDLEAVKWVQGNGGIDLLCNMKLYGYTVKKEQLYVLKFPKTIWPYVSSTTKYGVIKSFSAEISDAKKVTEKEIKAIDEKYWPFAVKVDEVEE